MIRVSPPSTPGTMQQQHANVIDTAYLVKEDVGAISEGDAAIHTTKWLVPMEELDERALHRHFDPDSIGASVVPSPMRGIRGFFEDGANCWGLPCR